MKRKIAIGIQTAIIVLLVHAAAAQTNDSYPDGPVKIVIPFAAGGMLDSLARYMGNTATGDLGKPVIIDNRPGAGGRVGATVVSQAAPDGQTLLFTAIGTMTILPLIPPKPAYEAAHDFRPVAALTQQPLLVAVRPSLNITSFAQFVELAKQQPGKLTYGSPGNGAEPHLATERMLRTIGLDLVHVPYRGGGPEVIDFMADRVDLVVLPEITLRPAIASNKVTILATLYPERLKGFPDVPSITELGYPTVSYTMTTALFAPAKTPETVVNRWNQVFASLQKDAGLLKILNETGSIPAVMDSDELSKAMVKDHAEWSEIIPKLNLTAE